PARRLLLPRGPDEPARGGGVPLLRPDREAGWRRRGGQAELPAARDRGSVVPLPGRGRGEAADRRRRQPLRARGRAGDRDPPDRLGARGPADRAGQSTARTPRLGGRRAGTRAPQGGLAARREPDAADRRGLARVRDDGGDVRRAQGNLGHLARDPGFLVATNQREKIASTLSTR